DLERRARPRGHALGVRLDPGEAAALEGGQKAGAGTARRRSAGGVAIGYESAGGLGLFFNRGSLVLRVLPLLEEVARLFQSNERYGFERNACHAIVDASVGRPWIALITPIDLEEEVALRWCATSLIPGRPGRPPCAASRGEAAEACRPPGKRTIGTGPSAGDSGRRRRPSSSAL